MLHSAVYYMSTIKLFVHITIHYLVFAHGNGNKVEPLTLHNATTLNERFAIRLLFYVFGVIFVSFYCLTKFESLK